MKFSRTITVFAICLILPVVCGVSAQARADFKVEQIAPGVYVHYGLHEQITFQNKGDIANIGFIVGDRAVAVIDTGGSRYVGEQLKLSVAQVTDLPVKYVILTHVHPDHVFGVSAFESVDGEIEIVGHGNLSNALIQRGEFYRQRFIAEAGFRDRDLELLPITTEVKTTLELDLGNRILFLQAMPTSHTDNDLIVIDQKTKTIWTGDLLFRKRVPVIDGSMRGWLDTMQALENIDVNVIIPGHGEIAQTWEQALSDQRDYLTRIADQVRKKINAGVSIQEAVDTVGREDSDKWLLFNDHHGQNVSRTFSELEWE